MTVDVPKKRIPPARRRERLRDTYWPDAEQVVWSRHENRGFTTIPRILPLVMHLQAILAPRGDPGKVYFDLWARAFDEGLVAATDDEAFAYSAGYTGPRAVRTWAEHIRTLESLGFIRIKQLGNREIGHILLLNPLLVCSELRREKKVPDNWWHAFVARVSEIGASIPKAESRERKKV